MNLKKIIIYYPKSEYFTALAINLLLYIAKRSEHFISKNNDLEKFKIELTILNEVSHLTIIELLESDEIFSYQKYMILRNLYKDDEHIIFSLENYSVQSTIYCDFYDDFKPRLPFDERITNIITKLSNESDFHPLQMICKELIKVEDDLPF
jgi:hypothetical protein